MEAKKISNFIDSFKHRKRYAPINMPFRPINNRILYIDYLLSFTYTFHMQSHIYLIYIQENFVRRRFIVFSKRAKLYNQN